MAYWWVYQGKSFDRALRGGYLWAPHTTKTGSTPYYYWSNVRRVQMSDIIFSHREGQIVAVATPRGPAYDAAAPHPDDNNDWVAEGWRLDVDYALLKQPLPYATAYALLKDLSEGRESPFAANGRPNQGFLFRLSDAAGVRLTEAIDGGDDNQLADALASTTPGISALTNTSSLSVVAVRLRQALFRRRLDQHWKGMCAVTGLEVRDLLRASHIKRWSDSDDYERLDPFNGLLLSAAYDAAFDKGLVTFDDDGRIIISTALSAEAARQAGIEPLARIRHLQPAHHPYLAHHRTTYFASKQPRF
jgi:hypothetical protein